MRNESAASVAKWRSSRGNSCLGMVGLFLSGQKFLQTNQRRSLSNSANGGQVGTEFKPVRAEGRRAVSRGDERGLVNRTLFRKTKHLERMNFMVPMMQLKAYHARCPKHRPRNECHRKAPPASSHQGVSGLTPSAFAIAHSSHSCVTASPASPPPSR